MPMCPQHCLPQLMINLDMKSLRTYLHRLRRCSGFKLEINHGMKSPRMKLLTIKLCIQCFPSSRISIQVSLRSLDVPAFSGLLIVISRLLQLPPQKGRRCCRRSLLTILTQDHQQDRHRCVKLVTVFIMVLAEHGNVKSVTVFIMVHAKFLVKSVTVFIMFPSNVHKLLKLIPQSDRSLLVYLNC